MTTSCWRPAQIALLLLVGDDRAGAHVSRPVWSQRTHSRPSGPLFYRALRYADVPEPHRLANTEEVEHLVESYQRLTPRSGAAECISKLRDAGFTVWAFTAGDRERVEGYFAQAGIDLPAENLISCHSLPKSKPYPDAYRPLYEELSKGGSKPWFAAAHMWDVSTARTVG